MDHLVQWIAEYTPWLLVAILTLNLSQRRHLHHGEGKRFATLYLSALVLAVFAAAHVIILYHWPAVLLLAATAAILAVGVLFRAQVFPFALYCRNCKERLSLRRVVYYDSNRCASCDAEPEQ